MPNVRISFIKAGFPIKSFDREAADPSGAQELALKIARDGAISIYDSIQYDWERKCAIKLFQAGKQIEHLETRAVDEKTALAIARKWAGMSNIGYDRAEVIF